MSRSRAAGGWCGLGERGHLQGERASASECVQSSAGECGSVSGGHPGATRLRRGLGGWYRR